MLLVPSFRPSAGLILGPDKMNLDMLFALLLLFDDPPLLAVVSTILCWMQGKFLELVPWNGEINWAVSPWGSWHISARGKTHEAVVHATAEDDSGTALRAPTINNGLTPFCRDSFYGKVSR